MKTIIVTGSVSSGKTTLSKKLSKKLEFKYVDINILIKNNKIYEKYDRKNKCYIVDIPKLNKFLIDLINKSEENLILDSHLSHYLPKSYVDICIVTVCDIDILSKRLKKRKYSKNKISDNLEAEIFKYCLLESKKNKHNVLVVDASKRVELKGILNFIKKN